MFLRSDYTSGKCTHRQYYGQFVTEQHKKLVRDLVLEGEHRTPLNVWDNLPLYALAIPLPHDDNFSLSFKVCLYKEAKLQQLEELNTKESKAMSLVKRRDTIKYSYHESGRITLTQQHHKAKRVLARDWAISPYEQAKKFLIDNGVELLGEFELTSNIYFIVDVNTKLDNLLYV